MTGKRRTVGNTRFTATSEPAAQRARAGVVPAPVPRNHEHAGIRAARTARLACGSRPAKERDATSKLDAGVPAAREVRGSDFLMFSTAQNARLSAFEQPRGERDKPHGSFLNALHIPERTLRSFDSVDRDIRGNRTNIVAREWDALELDEKHRRLRKWIVVRRIEQQRPGVELLNGIAIVTLFTLALFVGVGTHRSLANRPASLQATSHDMTSTSASSTRAGKKPLVHPADVIRDDRGGVVEVRGSDPAAVLAGFCKANQGGLCDPVELAWPDPPLPQVRIGLFRGFYDIRAIRIRHDPRTRQWIAGDGRRRIDDVPARDVRMGSHRVPVVRQADEI